MNIVTTFAASRAAVRGTVAVVPTMGFLHEGHLSLIEAAAASADTVVVTLYVNPLQFGPAEDLDRYPRDVARDAAAAAGAGAHVLFAPQDPEMYPTTPVVLVDVGDLGDRFEGAARPGHFAGVATVVAKLFAGLRPDVAWFGAKDAQQLAIVRRLTVDLSFPVEIRRGPTIRDVDGLALSSRNVYLSSEEREAASALSAGLFAAADAAEAGEHSAEALEAAVVDATTFIDLEYVAVIDSFSIEHLETVNGEAFLAAAASVGGTRLIDNVWLLGDGDTVAADRGVILERPSALGRAARQGTEQNGES